MKNNFTFKSLLTVFALLLAFSSYAQDRTCGMLEYMEEQLSQSEVGPILFVLDNFETVNDPVEIYNWLDTYIRNPNKLLITSS